MRDYPFIRAGCKMLQLSDEYAAQIIELARGDGAPADAWAFRGTPPHHRIWETVSDLESRTGAGAYNAHGIAAKLRQLADA